MLIQGLADKERRKGTNTFPTGCPASVAISSPLPNYSLSPHIRFFKGKQSKPSTTPSTPAKITKQAPPPSRPPIHRRRWILLTTRFVSQLHIASGGEKDEFFCGLSLMICLGSLLPQVIGVASMAAAEAGRICCVECRATTTPMWRSGPTGPRVSSLLLSSPLL